MGTNYYAKKSEHDPCDEGLHIGKKSGGWDFLFRAHPGRGIIDCAAWLSLLRRPDVQIVDEYGTPWAVQEFWSMATSHDRRSVRKHAQAWWSENRFTEFSDKQWIDGCGHPFANYEFC